MLNSRYIELTSSHRDRTRFPHPSKFTVELSYSGRNNTSAAARDPVYNTVMKFPPPILEFPTTYSNFSYMYGNQINGGNLPSEYISGILPTYTNTNNQLNPLIPLGDAFNGFFKNAFENSYIGDTLELISSKVSSVEVASNQYRKIVDYRAIPITEKYTYITTTIDAVQPILTTSVPLAAGLACNIDNFFLGWTILFTDATDTNLEGVTREVAYYRAYDRRIFFNEPILSATITAGDDVILKVPMYEIRLDTPFTIGALPTISNSCSTADNTTFRIRSGCTVPLSEGTLTAGTTTSFTLPATVSPLDYTGSIIWITSNPIVFSGALTAASFTASGGTQISGSFTLPAGASVFPDNFLNNMTINITSGSFSGYSYLITDWVNSTLTGTVTPGWTALVAGTTNPAATNTFTIVQPNPSQYRRITSYNISTRVGTVSLPFSYTNMMGATTQYAVGSADTFEILQFKKDNYQPLNYSESKVNQQQPHCYEISLTSLTLPNVFLKTGMGGQIAFYPYVYVQFSSASHGTSANDFNSNNPVVATNNIMFRAPMVNNYNPRESAFITLDGHGMVQELKFTPNDAFTFAVYLPNGELLITDEDYMSPSEPNPLLQITACFGIKRMSN